MDVMDRSINDRKCRSSHLTAASRHGASSCDEFTDLVCGELPDDEFFERVKAALASGSTRAMFNGAIAFGWLKSVDAEACLPLLNSAIQQCGNVAEWEVVPGDLADVDLPTTLELIQMEAIESVSKAGLTSPEALGIIDEALRSSDDVLHFAALMALESLGPAVVSLKASVQDYLDDLGSRPVPKESVPWLRMAATETLAVIGS